MAVSAAMGSEDEMMIDGIGRAQAPRAVAPASEAPAKASAADGAARPGNALPVADPSVAAAAALAAASPNLTGLARELAAAPPVDSAKVAMLRDAIVRGDYRPDPGRIAAAMIALESVPPTV
jgi:flagellar biosynthesis anti-sigma factor FlgM